MKSIIFRFTIILVVSVWTAFSTSLQAAKIRKNLTYTEHVLEDRYKYGDGERCFQWDKMGIRLDSLMAYDSEYPVFGVLQNYKSSAGNAPLVKNPQKDRWNSYTDSLGTERKNAIPLYLLADTVYPARYGRDGTLVILGKDSADYNEIRIPGSEQSFWVPSSYVTLIGPVTFKKVIFVDRTNQNAAVLERNDSVWEVRSMVPITTGLDAPPFKRATPIGCFVVLAQIPRMYYLHDGNDEIAGFAPYASRFCGGAYLHGVPLTRLEGPLVESSPTLGTTPRSHRCVRNYTSHALYLYDWATKYDTLVFVYD